MILIATLALSACAAPGPAGGIATYDALRQARDACAAKDGTFRLQSGGNPQYVEDFTCERK